MGGGSGIHVIYAECVLRTLSTLFAVCVTYDTVRNLVKCWPILLSCLQTNTLKVLVVRSVMRAV